MDSLAKTRITIKAMAFNRDDRPCPDVSSGRLHYNVFF